MRGVEIDEGEGSEEVQNGEEGVDESPLFVTEERVDRYCSSHHLSHHAQPRLPCSCTRSTAVDEVETVQDERELSEGHERESLTDIEVEGIGAVEE